MDDRIGPANRPEIRMPVQQFVIGIRGLVNIVVAERHRDSMLMGMFGLSDARRHTLFRHAHQHIFENQMVSVLVDNQRIQVFRLLSPGPVNAESDRAAVLAALESGSGVCIFPEKTATRFLAAAQPDIYVKGGDYTLDTLNQDERRAVESAGGKIVIVPFVPGKSTTGLLEKISRL